MEDPDNGAPSHSVKGLEETLNLSKNSGSDFVPDPTLEIGRASCRERV